MQLRFKHFAVFLISVLFSVEANATTVLVNQPEPYPQGVMGNAQAAIYYAGNATGVVPSSFNAAKGYRFIDNDSTTSTGLILLDVSTSKALTVGANQVLAVSITSATGTEVKLAGASLADGGTAVPAACVANSNCVNDLYGAYYTAGTTLRLSFLVTELCAASGSPTSGLCNGGVPNDTAALNLTQNIQVNFGVVSTGAISGSAITTASATTGDQSAVITFGITGLGPTTSCPSGDIDQYYFPGDGQIYLYTGNYGATANGGAPIQYMLTMALDNSTADTDVHDFQSALPNSLAFYAPYGNGTAEVTGFTNTTTGTDHKYAMIVQSQSSVGMVSASECRFWPVQSQDISGILKESKCFIATAAYHDGRAAPVMMLRKFRDHILSRFSIGQKFIKTYYHYSPAMAEWAWDKPIIRAVALKLLAPVELMAWAILKFSSAEEVPVPVEEYYIDRVKKNLPPEEAPSSESYSEKEKKRLSADEDKLSPDAKGSYVDRLKKQMAEEDKKETSPEGYAEKERAKLPDEKNTESPIAMVKAGKDKKPGLGDDSDQIKNAAGFKLGVTPGMLVSVSGGAHTFDEVYGSGFQPELIFQYERQFFHSENFGSFGAGVDFGVAYSGGNGLLQFGFGANSSKVSHTGFGFYQVPTILKGVYRFNLLRILRPYIQAGAGSIAYTETRSDAKGDKRGLTAVYSGSLGVNILLDFMDSGTHRDSFLSNGIQHTFLFVEYLYLNSFKAAVNFKRAGIYSGFSFEF